MNKVKERILETVQIMTDEDASKLWDLIESSFTVKAKSGWENIGIIDSDAKDLEMLAEIEKNPECRKFVSAEQMKTELGM